MGASTRSSARLCRALAVAGAALAAACSQGGGDSAARVAESPQQLRAESEAYARQPVAELTANPTAMELANRLFLTHCGSCHGEDGRASRGVVDLVAGRYNYGDSEDAIRTTIAQGRKSVMPPMRESKLGEVDVGQLVSYVQSLSASAGAQPTDYQKRGKMLFTEHCAACHGEDGTGDTTKGAPDLTDSYWEHGDSMMNVRRVISGGEQSESPAFGAKLSPTEIDLLTAYIRSRHRGEQPGS
ncbi:MAG TPA: c-type cytochrome [Gammaproteobacteria bacterium]|nr:c-type cytochrome [Gammaproteobacteria bacterium]